LYFVAVTKKVVGVFVRFRAPASDLLRLKE
jgi:hypothetical protein